MRSPLATARDRCAAALSWLRGAAVTWFLSAVYLVVVAGVSFPVVVGTVTAAFWLWPRLALGPVAGSLYFVGIGVVVMVEFALLRPLLDAAGVLILRPDSA